MYSVRIYSEILSRRERMRWESEKQGCNHCGRSEKSNRQENIVECRRNYTGIRLLEGMCVLCLKNNKN